MRRLKILAIILALTIPTLADDSPPPKPPAGTETRNTWFPHNDKLAMGWAFNEGAGSLLNDVTSNGLAAQAVRRHWTGTLTNNTWDTDGEGAYAKLGALGYITRQQQGATTEYPRGTIMVRLSFNALNATGGKTIFMAQDTIANGQPGELRLTLQDVGDVEWIRAKIRNPGGSAWTELDVKPTTAIATGTAYTIIFSWGEGGMRSYIHGSSEVATNSVTDSLQLVTAKWFVLGANRLFAPANVHLYAFAWWDWQLDARGTEYIDLLMTDPYLPFRPEFDTASSPSSVTPIVGRVTATGATWQWGGAGPLTNATANITQNKQLRVRYSSTAPYLDDANVTTSGIHTIVTADQDHAITIDATGLTADTTYYWQAEWRTAAGQIWYPFPGGRGKFSTLASAGQSYTVAFIADHHVGKYQADGNTNGFGVDIEGANETAHGPNHRWRLEHAMRDIVEQDPDAIIDMGDSWYADAATATRSWVPMGCQMMSPLFRTAPYYLVLGNHEAEGPWNQAAGTQNDQKKNTICRKAVIPNPTSTTYSEGGESQVPNTNGISNGAGWATQAGWIPALTAGENPLTYYNNSIRESANKLGVSGQALENYYAFTWGDALWVVLDSDRYSLNSADDQTTGSYPTNSLGTSQLAWLETTLAASTATWKFVLSHRLLGGLPGKPNTCDTNWWYARGSGASVAPSTASSDSRTEEWTLHQLLQQYNVTAYISSHDHVFGHSRTGSVNYLKVPTASGFNRFDTWATCDDYGSVWDYTDQLYALGSSRQRGVMYLDISATEVTVRVRQTSVDLEKQQAQDEGDAPGWDSYEVGDSYTVVYGTTNGVTVTEQPWDVLAVCDAADGVFSGGVDSATIETDWAGQNTYDDDDQDWGSDDGNGLAVRRYEEPHGDAVITLDPAYSAGDTVLVHYAPREVYTATLRSGTWAYGNHGMFADVPHGYFAVPETSSATGNHGVFWRD